MIMLQIASDMSLSNKTNNKSINQTAGGVACRQVEMVVGKQSSYPRARADIIDN